MKSIIHTLSVLFTLAYPAWDTTAQEIVGYSDLFTFDTRYTDVQGTISDSDNGNGIADALITLTGPGNTYTATSQANGFYSIPDVPAGNWDISVLKLGFEIYDQGVFITGEPSQTIDISLTPGSSTYLMITASVAAFADTIAEGPPDVFSLSGNVNINNVLFFDGSITIDMHSYLVNPEISGNCGFYAKDIGNQPTYWIKHNNIQFTYYATENRLVPQQWGYILDGAFLIGGFNITIGALIVDPNFDFVEVKSIAQMPFPIDKVMERLQTELAEQLPLYVEQMSGSRILSKADGVQTMVDISGVGVNLGMVQLADVSLYYNTSTQTYGGGFILKIPGNQGAKEEDAGSNIMDPETGRIPVEIRDADGQLVDSTSFDELINSCRDRDFVLVSLGAQIEFVQGDINKIIVTIGTKIPLGTTGLFLTEITGGVDDLATENWKIIANVDIELGYEVPVLGSPVKFNNFGVMIQPWNAFRGGGEFQVFNTTISEGYMEYNRPLSLLYAECKVNMYWGLLKGRTYLGLRGGHVSGSGSLSVNTPPKSELPWYLRWAGNKKIGSAQASFNNKNFQSSVHLSFIKFAQKLEFGKTSFPWFHYYLGRNMNHLHKIWKGERDGKQVVTFNVPENSKQLLVVAMDTLYPDLFDFTLEDPLGLIYTKDDVYYYEANDSLQQTIMSVLNPIPGEWDFLAEYDGQFDVNISITNQESTALIELPESRRTRSSQISVYFNDYADTMDVQVYYDISNQHFNGTLIDEFRVINNGTLDFIWQNQDVPNGEYYIYCRVDDGYNEPYLQYAPGSIWVENIPGIESPENFLVSQQNDVFLVSWDEPVSETIIAATVYYKNISSGRLAEESVYDSTSLVITDLEPGQEYQLWACFIDENGNFSEPGEKISYIFTSGYRNNPPYFTLDPDSLFAFVEEQQMLYKLTAKDADEDLLTYNIPGDILGITIFSDNIIWKPDEGERGVYDLMITVTDGIFTDTTYQQLIVYTPQQVSVNLAFNSLNLYENDNMFVKINNFSCPESYQQVTLKNMRTQEETSIETRRVNDFEYMGRFGLSFVNRTDISVKNGDTIEAKYVYLNTEYFAYSFYDSLPQPSDIIPPGTISDLGIESLTDNDIKLKWTATGNDAETGKAYRYDIRYAFEPINSEEVYYTAERVFEYPYPSVAGEEDSVILNLMGLQGIGQHSMVYFSIKAEDEMQNRGGLSNSPGIQCSVNPANITATVQDVYFVVLNWEGPLPGDNTGLLHYNIFRKMEPGDLSLLKTGITQTGYTDDLKFSPDGTYQYAIQAIYDTESSDTILSPLVLVERFVNVDILVRLPDTSDYQGIVFGMNGLDNIYGQQFSQITNTTGIVSLTNVFFSEYAVVASKNNYHTLLDTIEVSKNNHSFIIELTAVSPGDVIEVVSGHCSFFKLYPNPCEGIFSLEMTDADMTSGIRVEIYDMVGTEIMKSNLSGKRLYEIDLSGQPAGIYLLRVIKGDKSGTGKIISK